MTFTTFQKRLTAVGAEIVVTTLKDLVKLPVAGFRDRPLCALEIGIQFQSGLQDLETLLKKIP